ncbi:MAG: DUF2786 domain-containing protein [Candidatus Latescibacterota bacterium]|nr:DUF2786 domain-containing protein [Candidatus Latescibacterota bacterium]
MATTSPASANPEALDSSWIRTLYRWWDHYNRELLHGALRRPQIELFDGEHRLGEWDPNYRRIRISRNHIRNESWVLVLDTLRHEIAHQFVWEILDAGTEDPHGCAFAEASGRLRCSPYARVPIRETWSGDGITEAPHAVQCPADTRVLRIVKKLLSLAASSNENEAHAAVAKAQRLMLQHNIDLVELDRERYFVRRCLGEVKGRHPAWELWLAMVLNEFFFVEVLWARSYDARSDRQGTVLEVYGTVTNLEMAEYVHSYLCELLPRLWRDYRKRQGVTDNHERMRFFAGVLQGFHEKLESQRRALASQGGTGDERSLVWKGDARLGEFYRYYNPRIQTRISGGVASTEVFEHGLSEGRQVNIRQPVGGSIRFGGLLESAAGESRH